MIAQDTAELIILLKGCSQHWLKGAIGLKPITRGCPLTQEYWILHEQSFPAPSSLPRPGWLAHPPLALDLFTYLLKDANFLLWSEWSLPADPNILSVEGEERLIMSLLLLECLMKPHPPTPGSENSPLKSDKRIWSPEWDGMDKEKNQVGQKWNKLQQNTRMYKWTQTDARAIFINETDILHLFSLCTKR